MPEGRHHMYDWRKHSTPAPQAYVGSGAECREGVGGLQVWLLGLQSSM